MKLATVFTILLIIVSAVGPAAVQDPLEDELHEVLPRDAIPAISNPEFEPAERADRSMSDEELVIGLVGESEQRAYSTWQLDRHEIVNDTFGGRPVAVTWCPLCGTGVVYSRQVGGQGLPRRSSQAATGQRRVLTFGVSGMLFRDGLVMYDRETDTLWTHVDGRAVRGKLTGQVLEIVPSLHATWKEWKTLYPKSLVLKKKGEFRSPYEQYNRDGRMGILGRRLRNRALPGKERIIGVRSADSTTAFVAKDVRAMKIVEAQVGSLPVVLVAAGKDLPVVAFERRAAGRVLSFRLSDQDPAVIVDQESGSRWSLAHGEALDGPMKGVRLPRAPAYPAFWFGWQGYFPSTEIWKTSWRSFARIDMSRLATAATVPATEANNCRSGVIALPKRPE
jgi:hypothetical protein